MKINTDQTGIQVSYQNPSFNYLFNGEPIEVSEKEGEIILRNKRFFKVEEKEKSSKKVK
jgi:hypothetical protein